MTNVEVGTMSQLAAEIAKALTVAAVQAQPSVFAQDSKSSSDATKLGHEVALVFSAIFRDIRGDLPASDTEKG
jgi:hypothetical protein